MLNILVPSQGASSSPELDGLGDLFRAVIGPSMLTFLIRLPRMSVSLIVAKDESIARGAAPISNNKT